MTVPFNVEHLEVTGGAAGVVDGVMQAGNMPNSGLHSGAGQFAVSNSGILLYVPGSIRPDAARSLVWVNRSGLDTDEFGTGEILHGAATFTAW